jgi:hypothetical protein
MSVETTGNNDKPLEVLESFYQTSHSVGHGIDEMILKNGRFGMVHDEGQYFSSLQTSELYKQFDFFDQKRNSILPKSPLAMSKSRAEKNYIFRLDKIYHSEKGEALAKVDFIPKTDTDQYFSGSGYIDLETRSFRKILFKISQTSRIPFVPIHDNDRINNVDIEIGFNFREGDEGYLIFDFITLDYSFQYDGSHGSKTFQTKSLLVFYDYEHPFLKPICHLSGFRTDYEKIMAAPHNKAFWDNNYVFVQTEAMKDHTQYFRNEGIIVNYDDLCASGKPVQNPVKAWSATDKITWDDFLILSPEQLNIDTPIFSFSPASYSIQEQYKLDFQILLDCNMEGDSMSFCCRTVFNKKSSYYFLERDSLSLEYINLQFDLAESVRRQMAETLCSDRFKTEDMNEIRALYDSYMKRLETMQFKLAKEVDKGKNVDKLAVWKEKVANELAKQLAYSK